MANGPDIDALRQQDQAFRAKQRTRVRAEVERRGLASFMNQTRWMELKAAIQRLTFAPPYQRQDVLDSPEPLWESDRIPSQGCWCHECLEPFHSIEWLRIIPQYWRETGALLPLTLAGDCSEALRDELKGLNIPFREDRRGFWVYGYAASDPTLDPDPGPTAD